MKYSELTSVIRCPVDQMPLVWNGVFFVEPTSGRQYPESEGIIDLVVEGERYDDLGDANHYDKHPFEFIDWADGRWISDAIEPELKRFLEKIPKDALICDIGCGPGRVTAYLGAKGWCRVLALDYSRLSLEIARKNVSFPVIRANNLKLPLESDSVDAVISTGVIHHTPNPLKALSENCRVLKVGGRMYLKVYRFGSYYHILHLVVGGFMRALRKNNRIGRVLVDNCFFSLYCRATKIFKKTRTEEKKFLRALFEDYFLNTQTSFFQKNTISAALIAEGTVFERVRSRRPTDLYLVEKSNPIPSSACS